jgi:hypothetical protein
MHALISGSVQRIEHLLTRDTRKPFASVKVRFKNDGEVVICGVLFYAPSLLAELVGVGEGDAVSVVGSLRCKIFEAQSGPRVSLTMIADKMLVLRRQKDPVHADEPPSLAAAPPPHVDERDDEPALDDAL